MPLDGVYVHEPHGDRLELHPLASLDHEDVAGVASRTAARIRKLLMTDGRLVEQGDDGLEPDDFAVEQPVLLSC